MVHKYAVSFRIDTNTYGETYGERYSSLMEQIRKTGTWEETTSFALTTSNETIEDFVERLYLRSKFNAAADMLIAIDIERGVAVTKGKIEYPATLNGKLNKLALR